MLARVFIVACLSALISAVACSNQGEGERCDTRNGNDDCESGLYCTPLSQLAGDNAAKGEGAALCCPATNPTRDVCFKSAPLPDGGSSTGGSPNVPDASSDALVDAKTSG